jgi:hypothetical protein
VVQLDAERATLSDRDGEVEPFVLDAQLVEVAQSLAGEVADLGIVALALEFADHHHREHDRVLGEAEHGLRVGQQHRGVQHISALELSGRIRRRVPGVPVHPGVELRIHSLWNGHDDSPHPGAEPHPAQSVFGDGQSVRVAPRIPFRNTRYRAVLMWPSRSGAVPDV